MKLIVNGEPREAEATQVAQLLEELGVPTTGVAVMVNDSVVPASQHEQHRLRDDDRVELLTLAGGG